MGKKQHKFLSRTDVRKKYHLNEEVIRQLLPAPDRYGYFYGHRVPLWRRDTVSDAMSKPAAKAALARADRERNAQERALRRKEQEAKAIRAHLLNYDISAMIETARGMERRFVIHCGPTNSGKTYQSLQALQRAGDGCYLGPLRLLAIEMFDTINANGVPCSLLTGEESIEIPFSKITASTIEMCDFRRDFKVAVIDEAQLIADRARGGHWLNAILRVRAEEVHICVAPEGLELVEKLLAQIGAPYEMISHERLTPLVFKGAFPVNRYQHAQAGDALIAFSRKAVLGIAAELASHGIKASVIYGNLPPQSRREEVRKFAVGETSVVVATDAIGMGVSLPIRRIIFCQTSKFDGLEYRPLTGTEIKQIAGRAGRFGKYDEGQVLTMDSDMMIENALETVPVPFRSVTIPFPKEALDGKYSLSGLLKAWSELPSVPGFFYEDLSDARTLYHNLSKQLGNQLTEYPEDEVFQYITCPADAKNPVVVEYWTSLCAALLSHDTELPRPLLEMDTLVQCENSYKLLDLQHQMFLRAGIEISVAEKKQKIEARINELLSEDKTFMKRTCSRCGRRLPPTARFSICERCFRQEREGGYHTR